MDNVGKTGAVCGSDNDKYSYTSLPLLGLLAAARTATEGKTKYGRLNYKLGTPAHEHIDHAFHHMVMDGLGDIGEPNIEHAIFRLMAALESRILHPELNHAHDLGPGATLTPEILEHLKAEAPGLAVRRKAGEFKGVGNWRTVDLDDVRRLLSQRAIETIKDRPFADPDDDPLTLEMAEFLMGGDGPTPTKAPIEANADTIKLYENLAGDLPKEMEDAFRESQSVCVAGASGDAQIDKAIGAGQQFDNGIPTMPLIDTPAAVQADFDAMIAANMAADDQCVSDSRSFCPCDTCSVPCYEHETSDPGVPSEDAQEDLDLDAEDEADDFGLVADPAAPETLPEPRRISRRRRKTKGWSYARSAATKAFYGNAFAVAKGLRSQGESHPDIAQALNLKGYTTTQGKPFSQGMVSKLLSIDFAKHSAIPDDPGYISPDTAFIDEEEFLVGIEEALDVADEPGLPSDDPANRGPYALDVEKLKSGL